jgi:hypothetical protein
MRAAQGVPVVAWCWRGIGFSAGLGGLTGLWGEASGLFRVNRYLLSLHLTSSMGFSSVVLVLGPLRLSVGWKARA